ncbi:MAG: hypothetical protein O2797_02485 [Bacteroidetes bacterium]|nr:hypothetical protein [Bacteroidota bacterium]
MATIYKVGTQTIRPGKAWTDQNGVMHPASWHTYSAAEKAALGITEIVQQPHPDSRLYHWSYNADGTVNSTPKSLDDINEVDENGDPLLDEKGQKVVTPGVKSTLIAEVKAQQGSLLSQTDWAIVRKADTGIDVPAAIQQWRNEIRLAASQMEDQITQAATTDAVAALFLRYTSNDDGSVSKTGTLYDWPELSV